MPTLQRIELRFRAVRLLVQPHKLEKEGFLNLGCLSPNAVSPFQNRPQLDRTEEMGTGGTVERPVFLSEAGKNIV